MTYINLSFQCMKTDFKVSFENEPNFSSIHSIISLGELNLILSFFPLSAPNRKKTVGAKSGENGGWGETLMSFSVRKSFVACHLCMGALSKWMQNNCFCFFRFHKRL